MCDTFAVMANGEFWFAKNSDREPDEAQLVEWHPPTQGSGCRRTTYMEVDAPDNRYGCWLSRPDWMWGAEIGINQHGVAIGNQAVFTKLIDKKNSRLLGMDLVRLALEQSKTADDALNVIIRYLEKYGQGGVAGLKNKSFRYDNSFLIADNKGGWVLETAGIYWVAKKFDRKSRFAAISNRLTITTDFDRCSDNLLENAKKTKLWDGKKEFSFAATFSTRFMPWMAKATERRSTNLSELDKLDLSLPVAPQIAAMLRQHVDGYSHSSNADVCMHATGMLRPSQTTQSMIARLNNGHTQAWATGGNSPCVSLYKPLGLDGSSWLNNHPDFWAQWRSIERLTESDSYFKDYLIDWNQEFEQLLWTVPVAESNHYLTQWWQDILESQ